MRRRFALLVCLWLLCLGPTASAAAPAEPRPSVPVYVDGLLRLRGYAEDGLLFLAPEDLCRLFSLSCETVADENGCTLRLPQWALNAPADSAIYTVDGRYLYCPEGYFVHDGRAYFSADVAERLFGLSIRFDGQRADVDTSGYRLLRGGEDYYNSHYPAADLLWLIRIISAEAQTEPLEGQLGVGNVVLNRVRSEAFPATVMSVVLEREGDLAQFSPVGNGRVAAAADDTAVLAACLCLEGYNPVGESLYFVNPDAADATWFETTLTEVVRIGSHVFYKEGNDA